MGIISGADGARRPLGQKIAIRLGTGAAAAATLAGAGHVVAQKDFNAAAAFRPPAAVSTAVVTPARPGGLGPGDLQQGFDATDAVAQGLYGAKDGCRYWAPGELAGEYQGMVAAKTSGPLTIPGFELKDYAATQACIGGAQPTSLTGLSPFATEAAQTENADLSALQVAAKHLDFQSEVRLAQNYGQEHAYEQRDAHGELDREFAHFMRLGNLFEHGGEAAGGLSAAAGIIWALVLGRRRKSGLKEEPLLLDVLADTKVEPRERKARVNRALDWVAEQDPEKRFDLLRGIASALEQDPVGRGILAGYRTLLEATSLRRDPREQPALFYVKAFEAYVYELVGGSNLDEEKFGALLADVVRDCQRFVCIATLEEAYSGLYDAGSRLATSLQDKGQQVLFGKQVLFDLRDALAAVTECKERLEIMAARNQAAK
jgi:hypothetical protein